MIYFFIFISFLGVSLVCLLVALETPIVNSKGGGRGGGGGRSSGSRSRSGSSSSWGSSSSSRSRSSSSSSRSSSRVYKSYTQTRTITRTRTTSVYSRWGMPSSYTTYRSYYYGPTAMCAFKFSNF